MNIEYRFPVQGTVVSSDMDRREALKIMAAAAALPGMSEPQQTITRAIGRTSERLPVIGLGTWQTFDVGNDAARRQQLSAVLRAFVDEGGKLIDSSPMYGSSEEVSGDLAAQAGVADRLFWATKVWTSGGAAGVRQMEESMRKLRVRRIDLMQVHNLVDVHTHLATLREWEQQGRIRYLGVTHYTASGAGQVAQLIEREPVDFVQINYSVGEREAEKRLLPMCAEKGIAVLANRPFASGGLFSRVRNKPLPAFSREIECTSWAQLLLKFVVSHPAITCAIPATSRVEHLRDNMAAGRGRLPDPSLRQRIIEAAL